jgi:hypothetical protein
MPQSGLPRSTSAVLARVRRRQCYRPTGTSEDGYAGLRRSEAHLPSVLLGDRQVHLAR